MPGKETPGDLRITYKVLKLFENQAEVTAVGKIQDGMLNRIDGLSKVISKGIISKESFITTNFIGH